MTCSALVSAAGDVGGIHLVYKMKERNHARGELDRIGLEGGGVTGDIDVTVEERCFVTRKSMLKILDHTIT